MKYLMLFAAVVCAMTAASCHKDPIQEPDMSHDDTTLTVGSKGYLIIDGDSLAIESAMLSQYDGLFEYSFVPESGRIFAIVSAHELFTGDYSFVSTDIVYSGGEGVAGIRPSTCAPEYYSQGVLHLVRQGNGYDFDFVCATISGSDIRGAYNGRL